MNRAIIIFLFLASCGEDDINCGFITNELCVDPGNYYVDTQKIYDTINITEARTNEFYPGLNLPDLIKKYNLEAKYISKQEMTEKKGPQVRGVYYDDENIYIAYPDKWPNEEVLCVDLYYVLGHEILHFIFENYLDGSDEDGLSHNTNLFLQWAQDNNKKENETVEFYIYTDVVDICKEVVE